MSQAGGGISDYMGKNQDTERPLYATLRYDVLKSLKISAAEYMLLDMVYHLSAKHGYCYKSTYAIANDLSLTFNAVKAMTNRLVNRELLARTNDGLVCASGYIDVAYLADSAKNALVQKLAAKNAVNSAIISVNSAKTSDKNNNRVTINSIKVDNEPLATELTEFVKMRQALKKPITEYGLRRIRDKLAKLYPDDIELQRQCLNQSIENSWQGVFEVKEPEVKGKDGFKWV